MVADRAEPAATARASSFAAGATPLARLKGDRYLRRAEDTPDETRAPTGPREAIWR